MVSKSFNKNLLVPYYETRVRLVSTRITSHFAALLCCVLLLAPNFASPLILDPAKINGGKALSLSDDGTRVPSIQLG